MWGAAAALAALCLAGVPCGRAVAALCLAHVLLVFSLRLFSREAGACGAAPLAHLAAAAAAQLAPPLLPLALTLALCGAISASTYTRLVRMPRRPLPSLTGKIVIVTGCSSGIGLETARLLLSLGATVVFACRSEERAKTAIESVVAARGAERGRASFLPLDLSSCQSVQLFAQRFLATFHRCDALVCNAGAQFPERALSRDGFEQNMASNHLGHWLLTKLLLPALRESSGRVVAVASSLHKKEMIQGRSVLSSLLSDPMSERSYGMFEAYAKSKLAQVASSAELQRREPAIISVSLHPGNGVTEITRRYPYLVRAAHSLVAPLSRYVQPSAEDCATTSVFAVAYQDAAALRGSYLERSVPVMPAPAAQDKEVARQVWEMTESYLKAWSAPPG